MAIGIGILGLAHGHVDSYCTQWKQFLQFLQGKRQPLATAAEGRDVLRMTLACYKSAREGRRIAVAGVNDL